MYVFRFVSSPSEIRSRGAQPGCACPHEAYINSIKRRLIGRHHTPSEQQPPSFARELYHHVGDDVGAATVGDDVRAAVVARTSNF